MIINLTQHVGTPEQGVTEPADKSAVSALLTFEEVPTRKEIGERAKALAELAKASGAKTAMIGGAPFFMGPLERALEEVGIVPVYAFSKRESVEAPDGNGGIRKTQVFRHAGFVPAATSSFDEVLSEVRLHLARQHEWWLECHARGEGECDDRTQNALLLLVKMQQKVLKIVQP